MGRGAKDFLTHLGLTNVASEDYGTFVCGKEIADEPLAFCSSYRCAGDSYKSVQVKALAKSAFCQHCGSALKWKRIRKTKINKD